MQFQVLWFFFGLILGAIAALQAVAVFVVQGGAQWLREYQELIGAAIAGGVAVAAIIMANNNTKDQIKNSLSMEEARRAEKLKGSRAMLSFAMNELQSHTRVIIDRLIHLHESVVNTSEVLEQTGLRRTFYVEGGVDPTPLPEHAFSALKETIEVTPIEVGRVLAGLMREFQSFHARIINDDRECGKGAFHYNKDDLCARLVEQIQLYAWTMRCCEYAAFEKDFIISGPITHEEFGRAGRIALGSYTDFMKSLSERYSKLV